MEPYLLKKTVKNIFPTKKQNPFKNPFLVFFRIKRHVIETITIMAYVFNNRILLKWLNHENENEDITRQGLEST